MRGPADPVDQSVVPAGEMADEPEAIKELEITDQDDDVVGLLVKWDAAEWLWADIASYRSLEDAR